MRPRWRGRRESDSQVFCHRNSLHALAFMDQHFRHVSRLDHHNHDHDHNHNKNNNVADPLDARGVPPSGSLDSRGGTSQCRLAKLGVSQGSAGAASRSDDGRHSFGSVDSTVRRRLPQESGPPPTDPTCTERYWSACLRSGLCVVCVECFLGRRIIDLLGRDPNFFIGLPQAKVTFDSSGILHEGAKDKGIDKGEKFGITNGRVFLRKRKRKSKKRKI